MTADPTTAPAPAGAVPAILTAEDALRTAALISALNDALTEYRSGRLAEVVDQHAATGEIGSIKHRLGAVSTAATKDGFQVVDDEAFTTWVLEHHPDDAKLTWTVSEPFRKAVLGRCQHEPDGDLMVDRRSGETAPIPDGVAFVAGGRITSVSVRPSADLRWEASQAVRGRLSAILSGETMTPAVDGT